MSVLNGIPGAGGTLQDSPADFFSSVSDTGTVGATSTGPFFKSYCIDLSQGINLPKIVDLAEVSNTSGTAKDSAGFNLNLGAAGWIVDNYGVKLGVINTDAEWKALEALAGVNPANVTYLEQVAVTQTAVWAKAYGATSSSIVGSEGGTTNADANSLLTQLLALSDSNTAAVGYLDYPPTNPLPGAFNNQDQLFPPLSITGVPEPSSMALLGLGALGALGYSWKRRNRP